MKKNTASVQSYFNNHKGIDLLYFTSDGLAFFKENDANAQGAALKKNGKSDAVTPITRAEAFVADAETAPAAEVVLTPLEQAQKNVNDTTAAVNEARTKLEAANNTLAAANTAKETGGDAKGQAKAALSRAVTNATKAVADAQAEYDNAVLDAQGANDALAALTAS